MNIYLRNLALLSIVLVFSLPFSVANAKLNSMSLERTKVIDSQTYLEASVRCQNSSNSRFMRKLDTKTSEWCSLDVASLCHKDKLSLGNKICRYNSKGFRRLAEESRREQTDVVNKEAVAVIEQTSAVSIRPDSKVDQKQALRREQLLIEEQRIQIESRRLELVQKELELKKSLSSIGNSGE